MKINQSTMKSLLRFANRVKLDGKDMSKKPQICEVEKAESIQLVNNYHIVIIEQDEKIASVAVMKGTDYKDSFMAVFLYEFGMGRIEKKKGDSVVENFDMLTKDEFTEKLEDEGMHYISL